MTGLTASGSHPVQVRFLRSSLFIAIVSLLVLTGYSADVLDYCCDGEKQEQKSPSKPQSGKRAPAKTDDCKCICHQLFTHHLNEPVRVSPVALTPSVFTAQADEFPPDTVPVGIDYPPQLS